MNRQVCLLQVFPDMADADDMTTPPLKPVRAAALQQLLATQRDPHARQRELVRASLAMCPGKSRPAFTTR
jgi:hypothetical protein